ncbi:hypothetical protein PAAG_02805 [Paracoccidioides lutzii Pb01]|uniref:Putative gamma-glutamylcyclotransferase n=1 Tax=Paracoccidioides lutzii (strain ATCC MYA-826 / Pb01) TaxID=502779 RepID=C1GWB0_PARBA|nr:hypothetical protein PAAG_02805 [Paracoccidioides lutzii Pb01]EEH40829.1 hypothetical protein PAAG_02805 [Paracoccidioides lutzii Pb01]
MEGPVNNNEPPPTTGPHQTTSSLETSWDGPTAHPSWKPTYLFVYGSLMDLDVLQYVVGSPRRPPPLRPARLKNYKMKMWGIYPTLIPSSNDSSSNKSSGNESRGGKENVDEISGALYLVEHPVQFALLEQYESSAYTWHRCVADFTDDGGSTTEQSGFECRTFVWRGDPDSAELTDGKFDLEVYQKYYKPEIL